MLYRVTIGLPDHATAEWAEALHRGYQDSGPEADVRVVLRDNLLCAVASFDHSDWLVAGELARAWFVEASERAGIPDDTPVAAFDVLAVVGEP